MRRKESQLKRQRIDTFIRSFLILSLGAILLSGFGCSLKNETVTEHAADPAEDPSHVHFSLQSGVYPRSSLNVELTAPKGYTIAFTTDASLPKIEDDCGSNRVDVHLSSSMTGTLISHSDLMQLPVLEEAKLRDDPSLPFGCVLRAMLIGPDTEAGEVSTEVYFLGTDFSERFPGCIILSLVAEPDSLLDYETGILAAGKVFDSWRFTEQAQEVIRNKETWEYQANFTQHGKEWERPCLIQVYDGQSAPSVEQEAGIRVSGHASRMENQKSFNIYFRKDYGDKYFTYGLFDGVSRYRSFQLRNGGNNTKWLKFKGAMLQDLVSDRAFMTSLSRQAVLFLNGEYWGPYLLTEKISDEMVQSHYPVDADQVVVIKEAEVEEGTDEDILLYEELMSYADKDLTDPTIWDEFCRIINIRSFADYCATRIYIGDNDWSEIKNDVLWRTRDSSYDDGRWQYILYDVESCAGLYGYEQTAPETDHFRVALERYPLFAAAIRNREFYDLFLDSIREIGSRNFSVERVTDAMREYADIWEPLMPDYYKRFGNTDYLWNNEWEATIHFFENRYDTIISFVESYSDR